MNVLVEETSLQDIANAIREVTSIDEKIKPSEMGNTQRNFANGLIATANATTGKEDTTLTNAVNSLVEGYGQGGSEEDLRAFIMNEATELPRYIKSLEVLQSYTCYNKTMLKTVDLPNIKKIMLNCFDSCINVETVNLPKLVEVNGGAFARCSSLIYVNLPLLSVMINDADKLFLNCSSLTSVNMPLAPIVGANGFENCTSLTEICLPNVEKVYTSAFGFCSKLEKVEFYKAIQLLRQNTFLKCSVLTALILKGDTLSTLSYTNTFDNTPIANGTGYIYVPKALIEDYKVATNWTVYANQFRAIEDYPEICGGDTE